MYDYTHEEILEVVVHDEAEAVVVPEDDEGLEGIDAHENLEVYDEIDEQDSAQIYQEYHVDMVDDEVDDDKLHDDAEWTDEGCEVIHPLRNEMRHIIDEVVEVTIAD